MDQPTYSLGREVDAMREKLSVFARIPAKKETKGEDSPRSPTRTLSGPAGATPDGQEEFLSLMTPKQLERFDRLQKLHSFMEREILSNTIVPLEDSYFDRLATYNKAVKVREAERQPSPLASDEEYITSCSSDYSSGGEEGSGGRARAGSLGGGHMNQSFGSRPRAATISFNNKRGGGGEGGSLHRDPSEAVDLEWGDEESPSRRPQGLVIDPSRGGEGWSHSSILRHGGPLASLVDFSAALRDDEGEASPGSPGSSMNTQSSDHFGVIATSTNAVLRSVSKRGPVAGGGGGAGSSAGPDGAKELEAFKPWIPPHTALTSDPPQGWAANQSMPLFTRQVHKPSFNVEGLLDQQDWKCYGCWSSGSQGTSFEDAQKGIGYWDYDQLMSRAVGGIIQLSETVKFCVYTGHLFCNKCLPERIKKAIPARILQNWDVKPYPVCKDAGQFLEFHEDEPCLCVSAVNPALLHQCPLLHQGRRLRQQLQTLHLIGLQCPAFRRQFYQQQSSAFVSEHRRYLIEDTEFWSINDLMNLHKAQPVRLETGVGVCDWEDEEQLEEHQQQLDEFEENNPLLLDPVKNCELIRFMANTRNAMVRHVGKDCSTCLPRSCKQCLHCRRDTAIFEFDVLNVSKCSKCANLFHKTCWEMLNHGCSYCHQQREERKKQVAAAAA